MNTLATFSTRPNKHMTAAKNATNAAIGWGGTGALGGLLVRPNSGGFQRKVAGAAMGVGVVNSLRKSYFPRKQMSKRINRRRIK